MSWPYGDDYEYANTRLRETVVMYQQRPVYICNIFPNGIADCYFLSSGDAIQAPAKELETVPVKLGYANHKGRVFYLSRMPKRRDWRQGLRKENMSSFPSEGLRLLTLIDIGVVIEGIYPTLRKCIITSAKGGAMAWHRNWALVQGALCYKGEVVGEVVDDVLTLHDSFSYLKEALAEVV